MTKVVEQFEKMDVLANECDASLEKLRKECNNLVVELHAMGAVRDEILLYTTEIKWKNKSYRKINGASVRIFPLQYTGFPALQDTQLIPDNLLNVDFEDIPVCLLQSAGNISTSRIIAFLEFILNLSAQTFVKITPMSFVKLSVNTLETCAYGNATGPNPRGWKIKTNVLHCRSRREDALPKLVHRHRNKSS